MKRSKVKQYERILKEDRDWDAAYLLKLERFKLKKMIEDFEAANVPWVGIEYPIRDMKICTNLLDIILEEDAKYRTYLDQFGDENYISVIPAGEHLSKVEFNKELEPKFPGYINVRNAKRFVRFTDGLDKDIYKVEVRKVKALHLYNRIRNNMFSWGW